MRVIVDTPVWSAALRRATASTAGHAQELAELIREGRVVMLGPIRQEILSGVRTAQQFGRLRDALRPFSDYPLSTADFEEAAACYNRCRASGVQGSNTDFLVCSVALRNGLEIYTTDGDFSHFGRVLKIRLHTTRVAGSAAG